MTDDFYRKILRERGDKAVVTSLTRDGIMVRTLVAENRESIWDRLARSLGLREK